ncbi:hypothetical protein Tco_1408228 [Tanacetum coccineum]
MNSIRPPININNISYRQFTAKLFSSGFPEYYPTPPPPTVTDKGKGKAQFPDDDQLKQLMPFIDAGGSVPKLPNLQQLGDLKAKKKKSEKRLKVMTTKELKAHAEELATYKAKRANMLKECNHCITFMDDPLPITKFSYKRGGEDIESDRVLNWISRSVIGERVRVMSMGSLPCVGGSGGDLCLEAMEDEEGPLVDSVFEGAFGALGDKTWYFGEGVLVSS